MIAGPLNNSRKRFSMCHHAVESSERSWRPVREPVPLHRAGNLSYRDLRPGLSVLKPAQVGLIIKFVAILNTIYDASAIAAEVQPLALAPTAGVVAGSG